jgi:hypothetical protein
MNKFLAEDLIELRDQLSDRAFNAAGEVINSTLAEVVYKMNSCLRGGYPKTRPLGDPHSKLGQPIH